MSEETKEEVYRIFDVPPDRYVGRVVHVDEDKHVIDRVIRLIENNLQANLPDGPLLKVDVVCRELIPGFPGTRQVELVLPDEKIRLLSAPLTPTMVSWIYEKVEEDNKRLKEAEGRLNGAIEENMRMMEQVRRLQASGLELPPGLAQQAIQQGQALGRSAGGGRRQ